MDSAPGQPPPISREKLLQYRSGCLSPAEMEEVRRAVSQDPRLASCCKEEETFDQCIERCCKKESTPSALKDRIQACLADPAHASPPAATATATATATAKVASPGATRSQPQPAQAAARRSAFGAVSVGLAAMILVAAGIVGWSYLQSQPTQPLQPVQFIKLAHDPHNVIDQIVMNFDEHPVQAPTDTQQVTNIVNTVGLRHTPQSPAIAHLISVTGGEAPVDHQARVRVCFECTGHQTWNLTVLKVTPAVIDALHMHDSVESKNTHRTYYMCGDKTGKHPCAVFWEQDGKVMVLVAETSSDGLIAMADTISL